MAHDKLRTCAGFEFKPAGRTWLGRHGQVDVDIGVSETLKGKMVWAKARGKTKAGLPKES